MADDEAVDIGSSGQGIIFIGFKFEEWVGSGAGVVFDAHEHTFS